MTTGEKIRSARIQAGLTQEELAKKIGLTKVAISRYESGQREPKISILKKLSVAFGVKWEKLLDDRFLGDEEPETKPPTRCARLECLINASGHSRRSIALASGIPPSTLQCAIDRAEKTDGNISLDILYPISRVLGLPMWVFVCDSDDLRLLVSAMSGDLEEEKT